jgi:hypothetical protein
MDDAEEKSAARQTMEVIEETTKTSILADRYNSIPYDDLDDDFGDSETKLSEVRKDVEDLPTVDAGDSRASTHER